MLHPQTIFVADMFLFYNEKDFMLSLSDNKHADVNSTSRYLDDLLNIDNSYFEQTVGQIYMYPTELQLERQISLIPKPPF